MKNTIIAFSLLIFNICILNSCRKDLGNYDYSEQNHVLIENMDDNYLGFSGVGLKIKPVLKLRDGTPFDENKYSYEWFSYDSLASNADVKKVLSTEKDLDILLSLVPSKYALFYQITDKVTGYYWQKKVGLRVTTEIADGWLVLNDINNEARLDMLAFNAKTTAYDSYFDITKASGDWKIEGKPLMVHYVRNSEILTSKTSARVYVSTDKLTYSINNQIYTWNNYGNLKDEVMRPTPTNYHAVKFSSRGSESYLLDSEGVLSRENIPQATLYGPSLNRLSTGGMIEIAPFFADKKASPNYAVVFDVKTRRFLIHKGMNQALIVPTSSTPDTFKPENLQKDLVFLAYAPITNAQFYALLKDPVTKKLNLVRFMDNDTEFVLQGDDALDASLPIGNADFYEVDPTYGYIMYSVGGKVYQYDPFNKVNKLLIDKGSRTISLIKYPSLFNRSDRYLEIGKKLVVCTYDESQPTNSGKMELYDISLSGEPQLSKTYEGFGKIVSVSYRE
ncbi:PKD-like family lipoprotein [Sphingobacterium yanglingense]|uniref:PKD family protein n=1 Tax=Sphingobacterium yanglingense TaxID=1437280 RepID=A0A4R6W1H9_9SPHI|nr:PKD-like family lipoprotein [Sphingobacterium yanglingense]TDQ72227.1 PKD family protein [Sphingobacterium yanglingense]